MKGILRNVLIGLGLLLVVVGYTYIQVSTNESGAAQVSSLGSDMPLDQLSQNETVPKEKLSKTDVYLKDEYQKEEKAKELDKMMEEKDPQKLTSNFEAVYTSDVDKKAKEIKGRDLTPGYTPSRNKPSNIALFENNNSTSGASVRSDQPKIMRSSVPTNRKSELDAPKHGAKSDESYFNVSSVNDDNTNPQATTAVNETTMVKAAVMGKQEVKAGGVMRFRLMEKATFGGTEFARNTIFFAKCSFGQDRLNAIVERIPTKNGYKTIKMVLHDMDLMEGISAPVKEVNEAAMDETMTGVEDVLTSTGTVVGQAGSGLARIFRSSTNGQQKVSITDAYPVLFVVME